MIRTFSIATVAACIGVVGFAGAASAQVKDGTYRGTLVCTNLPFISSNIRTAIEVTISGNEAKYTRAVMTKGAINAGTESGTGTIDGQKISLKGAWKGDEDSYEANYSGTFVRRSAKLSGYQLWSHEKQSFRRNCSGAIKRPLAIFMQKPKT
jgi:hypothetical protein